MVKKLLILGGSANAIQILNVAHAMGIKVGVVDYYETSLCKTLADYSYKEDVFDIHAIVNVIKREKYDGLITGYSEQLLKPYGQICEIAGLPCYGSTKLFEISTDKRKFKELCHKYDVPVMPEYSVKNAETNRDIYPLVVKPSDSAGAVGVKICRTPDDFRMHYSNAIKLSKTGRAVIEKCATGKEATFFYYFDNGNPVLTIFGDRLTMIPQNQDLPMPVGYIFPADINKDFVEAFDKKIKALFKNEGFRHGMAFAQVFIEPTGIFLCEIGYRLTPSFETFAIDALNSFNPLKGMIEYAVGNHDKSTTLSHIDPYKGFAANVTFLIRNGKIATYVGTEKLEGEPCVIKVLKAWEEGHVVESSHIGTLAQIGLRVILKGESRNDLINKIEEIKDTVKILDNEGQDMVIRNFNYKELCQ